MDAFPRRMKILSAALALAGASSGIAQADTVVSLPNPSALPASVTYTNGSAQVLGDPSSAGGGINTYTLAIPGSYNYGQSFGPLTPFSVTTSKGTSSYAFYTDYVFTVAPSSVDSLSSTIDLGTLGVNGLQARLYSYSAGSTQNLLLPAFSPSGGVIDAWSTSISYAPGVTGTTAVISPTTLGAGTYVLELRGTSVGSSGGSYSGVLNLTPVPLPAALPLMLSGLGLVGSLRRRRRTV